MKKHFFFKRVGELPNPPDELAQNVSLKNPCRTNYSSIFSSKVQNLTVFSIIYMIRTRFFGPGELIQRYFSGAQYSFSNTQDILNILTGRILAHSKKCMSSQTRSSSQGFAGVHECFNQPGKECRSSHEQ